MNARILGRQGNVIEADFRQQPDIGLSVEISAELLYCDELVCLARIEFHLGGRFIGRTHITSRC